MSGPKQGKLAVSQLRTFIPNSIIWMIYPAYLFVFETVRVSFIKKGYAPDIAATYKGWVAAG